MNLCAICHGEGWVCERHPLKAWTEGGCMCGAGMHCECNPSGDWDDDRVILASVDPIEQAGADGLREALKRATPSTDASGAEVNL